jgi:hypothetical protein
MKKIEAEYYSALTVFGYYMYFSCQCLLFVDYF